MRYFGRILALLLLGALSIFGAGLPASAATAAECVADTDGYAGSEVCSVTVTEAQASCVNDLYMMTYAVTTEPGTAATVDLVWNNPGGSNVTQSGQPLSGTVPWPSSLPKTALDVQFIAGATATVRVDPTLVSVNCGQPGETTSSGVLSANGAASSSGVLAETGSETLPLALAGGALLLTGAALLAVRSSRLRRLNAEN